ncbi:putative quinol monooxygenase [Variovorax ureilyticus]|uniref:Quinol monooxygenase n=1 Tax=Variovorax ureilyticus TaxID=1836198 RepID=A0ABU8VMQ1_9BURK
MTKLAVIGTIDVQPGARAEVLSAVLAHRDRCLRDEPGTLQFEVLVPTEEPTKLMLYELYADNAAFSVHMKGASVAKVMEEVGAKVVGLTGIRCTPGPEFSE